MSLEQLVLLLSEMSAAEEKKCDERTPLYNRHRSDDPEAKSVTAYPYSGLGSGPDVGPSIRTSTHVPPTSRAPHSPPTQAQVPPSSPSLSSLPHLDALAQACSIPDPSSLAAKFTIAR